MEKIVDKFCGLTDWLFSTLLDSYQMIDWKMSWKKFVEQVQKEVDEWFEKIKNEQFEE